MLKSNFGNLERISTVAMSFASCKLVKEEYKEVVPNETGFEFWNGWELIGALYNTPKLEDIKNNITDRIYLANEEYQTRDEIMDGTYVDFEFYLDVNTTEPKYYRAWCKFWKGREPEIHFDNILRINVDLEQAVVDAIARHGVKHNLLPEA